jgi:hypothetical protein
MILVHDAFQLNDRQQYIVLVRKLHAVCLQIPK